MNGEGLSVWPFIHSTYRFTHPGGWRAVLGTQEEKNDGDSGTVPDGRESAVA